MREVTDFLGAYDAYFLFGLCVLSLVLLIISICLARKLSKLGRRRSAKLEEGRVGDIVDCLANHWDALSEMQVRLDEVMAVLSEQGRTLERCLKKMGIVRFNAFDDVGGEQSFAVVLLDSEANGVALSSLYGRQDSRVYAKAIFAGQGERPLSDEEQQALAKALK
jgi:hypothetical protein